MIFTYIAYSINSLDKELEVIRKKITEFTSIEKRLSTAKGLAVNCCAKALSHYGIDKLEGAAFKSITVNKIIEPRKLVVLDHQALIDNGYFRYIKVLDEKRLLEEYVEGTYRDFIKQYAQVDDALLSERLIVKINKRDNHKITTSMSVS